MVKIPEKYLKYLDYLFIFRPTLFFPIWIITLSGLSAGSFFSGNPIWWSFVFKWTNFLVFLLITLASGATFILNQIQSLPKVKADSSLSLISENFTRIGTAKKIAIYSIIISLAGLVLINLKIFIFISIVVLLWGYMFNYPPFNWKDKPSMSIVGYLVGGLLLFFNGWTLSGSNPFIAWQYSIPYMFAWLSVIILTQIDLSDEDRKNDKTTIDIRSKKMTRILISFILLVLCFGISLYNQDPIISLPALLSLPLFVVMVLKPTDSWITRSIRYPILFLALMLSCEFPLFFIILFISYYLCKSYYFSRFNLIYPTFQVGDELI